MRFIAFALLLLAALPATAADRYAVPGISIDMATDNPQTARDVALQKATNQAYTALRQKLQNEGELLPDITGEALAPYVKNFELTGERISAKRYIGTFAITFDPNIASASSGMMMQGTTAGAYDVPATFAFASLNEWQQARVALRNAPGVRGWSIGGMRRGYVDISLQYSGTGAGEFTSALAGAGIVAVPPNATNPRWYLTLRR